VTPTHTAKRLRTPTWIYADRVTGMPFFIGQPRVNTHIMSILCNATKFNVRRGIMLGIGHTLTAAKPHFWVKTALEPRTWRFGPGFVAWL